MAVDNVVAVPVGRGVFVFVPVAVFVIVENGVAEGIAVAVPVDAKIRVDMVGCITGSWASAKGVFVAVGKTAESCTASEILGIFCIVGICSEDRLEAVGGTIGATAVCGIDV